VVADSEGRILGVGVEPTGEGGSSGHNGYDRSVIGKCAESSLYDRELKPNLISPMLLPADPERMTPLIEGLPDSLKPIGIQLQGRIQNTPSEERTTAALDGGVTFYRRQPGSKVWTRGKIAQELINYGRKYGPVNWPYQRAENRALRASERGSGQSFFLGRIPYLAGKEKPLNRQGLWQLGLQKGIPRDLMDGLRTKKLGQLVQRWSGQGITFGPGSSAPPLVNLGVGERNREEYGGKLNPPPHQGEGGRQKVDVCKTTHLQ